MKIKTILFAIYICSVWLTACQEKAKPSVVLPEAPNIFPDYTEVTIPPNIAPLNFEALGDYEKIEAFVEGSKAGSLHIQSKKNIQFPQNKWKELLLQNKGGELHITLSIKQNGTWTQYAPFNIYVNQQTIDTHLTYRLIAPGYEVYSKMGIYQRDLSSFVQKAIIENTLIPNSCMNCHSFCKNQPDKMSLHLRGDHGATILKINGKTELYNTKTDHTIGSCVYPYWHPSGKYIAYSVNQTKQVFHAKQDERVEVIDLASDIAVYNPETNELFSCPLLSSDSCFETFPAFSPDGKTLYFCSSNAHPIPEEYKEVKYNLCSIGFNPEDGTFANHVDTLVRTSYTNKSVSFPRPSPNGKYLIFTLSDYGNFSIWHREADLWMINLATQDICELSELNSPDVESYHSWSSDSHWMIFSSRRLDGLYTRPFIAFIDDDGHASKPFLLPQENPRTFYEESLFSFNVPEFVNGEVSLPLSEIEKKALSKERKQMKFK